MPTFFFNLRDGNSLIKDLEGEDFETIAAARQVAVFSAREILAELVRQGNEVDGQSIDILDATGAVVATVSLMDELHLKLTHKR